MSTSWWFATHLKKYFVSIWNHHPDIPRLLSTISLSVQSSFFGRCDPNSFRVGDSFTAFRKDVRKRQWIYQTRGQIFISSIPFWFLDFCPQKWLHNSNIQMICHALFQRSQYCSGWCALLTGNFRADLLGKGLFHVFQRFLRCFPLCARFLRCTCITVVICCSFCAQLQWIAGNPGFFKMELSVWPNREPIRPFHILPSVSMPSPRSCKSDLHRTEEGSMKHHANHDAKPEKLCQTLGPTHTQTM